MKNTRHKSAIVFQFMLLFILTFALIKYPSFGETILGAFIGMLVGIGTENISKLEDEE